MYTSYGALLIPFLAVATPLLPSSQSPLTLISINYQSYQPPRECNFSWDMTLSNSANGTQSANVEAMSAWPRSCQELKRFKAKETIPSSSLVHSIRCDPAFEPIPGSHRYGIVFASPTRYRYVVVIQLGQVKGRGELARWNRDIEKWQWYFDFEIDPTIPVGVVAEFPPKRAPHQIPLEMDFAVFAFVGEDD